MSKAMFLHREEILLEGLVMISIPSSDGFGEKMNAIHTEITESIG
ncbi:MAG: hypothetical protein M0Z65_01790 [Firmicutes bacterium]|uniref:Uncharacterized protein n=1 Tax=Melghirimyces thermohalophilus TaxID=1236220 RepID=A0A1G6JID6_9BACL|nr:hypothetical protein [Melghirimyces thermohalophilus]MDA8351928.1 hypothetical protein [Bacillota bacterium]SDC18441.1 hypothetical protein SAMN04488112_10455 [Melghirimyces thermohalophilus]